MRNRGNCFVAIFASCVLAAACGSKPSDAVNTNAPANTTANTAATKNAEPAKSILKPGDVSPDKAVKVIELVDSVAADKDAWKGKEVAVTGYVSGTSNSGNHQLVTLLNEQTATNAKEITCAFQGDKPDGIFTKTVEVKGKISSVSTGEVTMVNLEPCELKK